MNARVTSTLGALLAAAALTACGSSYSAPTTPTQTTGGTATLTITIVGMNGSLSFTPNPSSIVAAQSVAFRNADTTTHQIVGDTGSFDTGALAPGATSAPITMSAAGAYPYHCSIHPTMVGTLNVTSSTGY